MKPKEPEESEFHCIRGDLKEANLSNLHHLVLSDIAIDRSTEEMLSVAILQLQSIRISNISTVLTVSFQAIFQSSTLKQVFLSNLRIKVVSKPCQNSSISLLSLREVRTCGFHPKRKSPFPHFPELGVLSVVGCSDPVNYWVMLSLPYMKRVEQVEIRGYGANLQDVLDMYVPSLGKLHCSERGVG